MILWLVIDSWNISSWAKCGFYLRMVNYFGREIVIYGFVQFLGILKLNFYFYFYEYFIHI